MKNLIELKLDDGTSILVESETEEGGFAPATADDDTGKKEEILTEVLSKLRSFVRVLKSSLGNELEAADQIEIEFGIKFGGKFKFFIADSTAESSVRLRATWKRSE